MPKMKDSGIDWIGEIPKDWILQKGKYLFQQRNQRGNRISLQLLSPTQNFGVIPQEMYEKLTGMTPVKLNENADLNLMKTIHIGDFCISLRSFEGGFEYSEYEGVVSPAYQVFYPVVDIADGYYKYLFKENGFIGKMNSYTMTLRDGKNIAFSDFGDTYIPYPPVNEQQVIADFLDDRCADIVTLTSDIESQIDMLEQYKRSVITEAVTKGLNQNAEMKSSGVEWIGKIPKDWELSRIKYVANMFGRIGFRGYTQKDLVDETEGAITLSPSNFSNMKMNYGKCSYISWGKYFESPEIMINDGDILFVKTGSTYGKSVRVDNLPKEATINPQLLVFKNIKIDEQFFFYSLQSQNIRYQIELGVVGGTIPTISQEKIGNFILINPPLSEQKQIADYLDSKCSDIDTVIADKQAQLGTLAEYKKSLIYEYVTGKREVM